MMHVLFNWAMRWELIPFQINPMNLVHIKGSSKREREPRTLTIEEFRRFIEHVSEPFRTMCIVTACLGLRVSEMLGLKWGDFDWDDLRVKIQRSWVAGVEDEVKTLYSKKWMPVDPILAELLQHKQGRLRTQKTPIGSLPTRRAENRTGQDAYRNIISFQQEKRLGSGASVGTRFVTRTRRFCGRSVWT